MLRPIVCYVTDRNSLAIAAGSSPDAALIEKISEAARAGVDWVQLREKDLEARPLCDLAGAAIVASRDTAAKILLNDRLDVAWAAEAAGVHLGQNSLPAVEVVRAKRQSGRRDFLIGVSCHSPESAAEAASDGADYVFFGPVFATPSKAAFGEPQGLARLAAVCGAAAIPVLAIGGITSKNAGECLAAGAAGIAAIRLFQEASDLAALMGELR